MNNHWPSLNIYINIVINIKIRTHSNLNNAFDWNIKFKYLNLN